MIRMKVAAGALALALGAIGLVSAPVVQAAPQDTKTIVVTPININTATAIELEKLPGVGPSMAARIVDFRQKNGPFKKLEDILETSRSCPCLLSISRLSAHQSVARNR